MPETHGALVGFEVFCYTVRVCGCALTEPIRYGITVDTLQGLLVRTTHFQATVEREPSSSIIVFGFELRDDAFGAIVTAVENPLLRTIIAKANTNTLFLVNVPPDFFKVGL
jgi:hypothetical protein